MTYREAARYINQYHGDALAHTIRADTVQQWHKRQIIESLTAQEIDKAFEQHKIPQHKTLVVDGLPDTISYEIVTALFGKEKANRLFKTRA